MWTTAFGWPSKPPTRRRAGTAIRIAARGDLGMLLVPAGRREEARPVMPTRSPSPEQAALAMNEQLAAAQLGFIDVLDADYESARRALASAADLRSQRQSSRGKHGLAVARLCVPWSGTSVAPPGRPSASCSSSHQRPSKTVSPELVLAMGGLARAVEEVDLREGARFPEPSRSCATTPAGLRTRIGQQDEEIEDRFEQSLVVGLGEGYVPRRGSGRSPERRDGGRARALARRLQLASRDIPHTPVPRRGGRPSSRRRAPVPPRD